MILFNIVYHLTGQLSPGPLTSAHSHLEGMSNCTQCHDIGQKVPNSKCLACHEIIQDLLISNRGYHANETVRNKECIECHSEHHGKKFDMMRFDTENFDHSLTAYDLEGSHARIDCKECHKADNIIDLEIRKRDGTYLGLDTDCLTCHEDQHQGTLSNSCIECHDFEAFVPASNFNHLNTEYPLLGEHQDLECISCHTKERRQGKDFQVFSGILFNDCINCHDDPHGNIPGSCSTCHIEESFQVFKGSRNFNHNLTEFELKGSHRKTDCFECHQNGLSAQNIFSDLVNTSEDECIACHEDVHEFKFGTNCSECHNERSFHELNASMEFNHHLTDFPLLGLHEGLDCALCHKASYTVDIDFENCIDCHEDYHDGEFIEDDASLDCDDCHIVFEDFSYTTFGFEEHTQTEFPLEGAHMATPCFACHLSEDSWAFRSIGTQCVNCHEDVHEGYIDPSFYPEQNCEICHNSENWQSITFDHALTDWPLENKHIEIDCRKCHFTEGIFPQNQSFNKLESNCFNCHEDVHANQFEEGGITDCARCHNTVSWIDFEFDHNQTQFPLEGKHAELECAECHIKDENEVQIFKIEKYECIDCHS